MRWLFALILPVYGWLLFRMWMLVDREEELDEDVEQLGVCPACGHEDYGDKDYKICPECGCEEEYTGPGEEEIEEE